MAISVEDVACLSEEQDTIGAANVEGDTTVLIASKLVPEAKDRNSEFIVRPDLNSSLDNRSVRGIEPVKE